MIRLIRDPIFAPEILKSVGSDRAGALVTFDGRVRNHSQGRGVLYLYYEAYPEMALRELEKIVGEARRRWELEGVAVTHRLGRLEIGESSVFVAVSSPHRGEAFEACRFVIDTLKSTVPIWKKEYFEDGEVWVEGPDTQGPDDAWDPGLDEPPSQESRSE